MPDSHFTLEEMTRTSHSGFDNSCPPGKLGNLCRTVVLLEGIRELLGCPIKVNSGYRCPGLNKKVGGHPFSAHLDARAADIVPQGMPIKDAYEKLAASAKELGFDKLYMESSSVSNWIHVQVPVSGVKPRKIVAAFKVDDKGNMTRLDG